MTTNPAVDVFLPFRSFTEFVEEADNVLFLTRWAITEATGLGRLAEVVHKDKPERSKDVERARWFSELAQRERDGDFALATAHSAVALWAALEATIPQFIVRWLLRYPSVLTTERFAKLRLPVATYERLSREELLSEIVEEVTQSAPMKAGVGRFEAVLDLVGLEGGFDVDKKRDLLELSHVRHLVVHRFGVVDGRFRAACPWLEIGVGKRIKLKAADYTRYSLAAREYVINILERARAAKPELVSAEPDQIT